MTQKQAECYDLYERGFSVKEIAAILGKNHATISNLLRAARMPKKPRKPRKNANTSICPYCSCCFICPLSDCVIPACQIVNLLPDGFVYRFDD